MLTFKQFIKESSANPLFKRDIKSGAKMILSSTPKDFDINASHTGDIIGAPIQHHGHIARLSQAMRNPNVETFHHIYTKGDKVVGHTSISNNLPSKVGLMKHDDPEKHFDSMRERMKNLDADGYFMVHNHPSGDPTPSQADHNMTGLYKRNVEGFRGHVIVNHKKYTHIHPEDTNDYSTHEIDQKHSYDLTNVKQPHESTGKAITGAASVAEIAKGFENPNHATLIGASTKMKVRAAAHMPLHLLQGGENKLKAHARMRKFIRMTGSGANAIIGVPNDEDIMPLAHLVHHGLAHDVVSHSGKSIRSMGVGPEKEMYDLAGSVKHMQIDK